MRSRSISPEIELAELFLEHSQGGVPGPAGRLADLLHVGDMQVNQVAERAELGDARCRRYFAAIDLALGVDRPAPGVFLADEILTEGPDPFGGPGLASCWTSV